tara:strand:- start:176 stop:355 length:180 start_codon:yes stop_codon:yes gene_type:complete
MCVLCNLTQNDIVEAALAVQSTVDGEYMTIPLKTTAEQIHSFDIIQSMLLNANLIALIF